MTLGSPPPYTVSAHFHVRADAIDAMKQLIADVTRPSLIEHGCQIYHWAQGAEDPALFLLYMEWQDKASFEAHVATQHVKEAEQSKGKSESKSIGATTGWCVAMITTEVYRAVWVRPTFIESKQPGLSACLT
ncbi:MAG TPA: antibiotic biosynthesis monooxygenase [Candidatus Binatia bacterium]